MKNVNLIFWVKSISLVANFGSTRFASTSVVHKQRIKKSHFLTPRPPPSGLKARHKSVQPWQTWYSLDPRAQHYSLVRARIRIIVRVRLRLGLG